MADADQTIIIKKINKGGHGHHGGAWKVAYADFVTAMMAFFLLMWLLNATEAENLAGLADYFAPTVGVQGEMGIGFRGGKGALSKGIGADKNTNRGIVFGGMPAGPIMKVTESFELVTEEVESEKIQIIAGGSEDTDAEEGSAELNEVAEAVKSVMDDVAEDQSMEESLTVSVVPEGIEIQITDSQAASMFSDKGFELQPRIMVALSKLAEILRNMPNYISITGHTSSVPVVGRVNYSNWELSADRANSTRRFLVASGVEGEQIARVIGKADNSPYDFQHPEMGVNNRISIVLLRKSILPMHKKSTPEKLFIDPDSDSSKDLVSENDDTQEESVSVEASEAVKDAIMEMEAVVEERPQDNFGLPSIPVYGGGVPDSVLFGDEENEAIEKAPVKKDSKFKSDSSLQNLINESEAGGQDEEEVEDF